jgi:hypothetical protein
MKELGHFPTENGMGTKKTYSVFSEDAQGAEKL